jgi:hypothetical protein
VAPSFNLIWSQNGTVIRGTGLDGQLVVPVGFPGEVTAAYQVTLHSSAQANGTLDILSGVKFYLTGAVADLATVQGSWPNLGFAFSPPRNEMNGGLQISFDGSTWHTFSKVQPGVTGSVGFGDQNDPTTWIPLPSIAIGSDGTDETLGPFDVATLYLRYIIPATATAFKVFDLQLAVDCDIT